MAASGHSLSRLGGLPAVCSGHRYHYIPFRPYETGDNVGQPHTHQHEHICSFLYQEVVKAGKRGFMTDYGTMN